MAQIYNDHIQYVGLVHTFAEPNMSTHTTAVYLILRFTEADRHTADILFPCNSKKKSLSFWHVWRGGGLSLWYFLSQYVAWLCSLNASILCWQIPSSLSHSLSPDISAKVEQEREWDGGIKAGLSARRYGLHQETDSLPSFLPSCLLFFKQTSWADGRVLSN